MKTRSLLSADAGSASDGVEDATSELQRGLRIGRSAREEADERELGAAVEARAEGRLEDDGHAAHSHVAQQMSEPDAHQADVRVLV